MTSKKEAAFNRFRNRPTEKYSVASLAEGIESGDIAALGKAITYAESHNPEHRKISGELIENLLPKTGHSIRVGVTGVPGVGKSTFIESFGKLLLKEGFKPAVLAIDPSSNRTGGSILGDKTRMEELSRDNRVFIRPSPSAGALGGVANATRESILLCEAFGFDFILVETVGVGQSEVMVREMVDFFLLLMLAGAGDELQGIKRGIMEMADMLVINKSEGDNQQRARKAAGEYRSALHLFPESPSKWITPVRLCSGLEGIGLQDILKEVIAYRNHATNNGFWEANRKDQDLSCFKSNMESLLMNRILTNAENQESISKGKLKIESGLADPYKMANEIVEGILKKIK